jgi:hypothetical protein
VRGERLEVANRKAKKTFYKYHLMFPRMYWYDTERDVTYPHLGAYRKTKVFCSNPWCCGNGRRQKHTHNVTMQELKSELYERMWSEEEFDSAVYPSGKGTVCKTDIGGSIPSTASNFERLNTA